MNNLKGGVNYLIHMKNKLLPYLGAFVGLFVIGLFAHFSPHLLEFFENTQEHALIVSFFIISIIFGLSFGIFHLSQKTVLPSFVMAIFCGIVAKPLLLPVVEEKEILSIIVGLGATLILFGGGLETPFTNFKKLFWKITSLSFPGLFLTSVLFSFTVWGLGQLLGIYVPLAVSVLLGAVLASTDPAAIIPILKKLRFKNRSTKDIIVSESAVTDVTGTLLTLAFLGILSTGGVFPSIIEGYATLFTREVGLLLLKQIIFGAAFGAIGYFFLSGLIKFKKRHEEEFEADAAFFLFVPVIIFAFAVAFGGSGYLAAFVAGLLFTLTKHLHRTENFFNHMIEGFFKPTIFMLLGALVDIQNLLEYAVIGILAAIVFMFVIRPLSVFLSIGPFSFFSKEKFNLRELLFISFVRETGAIPAVLLVTIVSTGITGLEGLVPIGMWIILLTLIIEPPLTPLVAKWLNVAEIIEDDKKIHVNGGKDPFVVLGSRGYSFIDRLETVVDWAVKHQIFKVVLLHCAEDKYTDDREQKTAEIAQNEFKKINSYRESLGQEKIDFRYISRKGFLQNNINEIAKAEENVSVIFVGRKVLDYRLEEIKELRVPLYFID